MDRGAGQALKAKAKLTTNVKTRLLRALPFVAAALAAGIGLAASARRASPPTEVLLAAIPADAMLVATADLQQIRASSVLSPLMQKGRELPGFGKLDEICDFDPLTKLRKIAIAVPSGDEADFGVAASGAIEAEPLVRCATKLIEKRGGQALVETAGSFTTVRDAKGMQSGQIAVRQNGPVLFGEGAYLQRMIRAAERAEPNVLATSHPKLRSEAEPAAIVATVLIPEELKERARDEVGDIDSPAMRVTSFVAAVSVDRAMRIAALAHCDAKEPCAQLAETLREARDESAKDIGARLLGVGTLLDRVRIEAKAERLQAHVDLTPEEATALVDRLLALRALRRAFTENAETSRAPELPLQPSEIVTPTP